MNKKQSRKIKMASKNIPFSFSLLLVCCSMVMVSADQNSSSSFIRTSCLHTLYPDLCYSSLSPYKRQVGNNPVMLARFAMNATIGSLKPLSTYIGSVLQRQSGALKDCKELIGDAIDLVRKSEKEITGLDQVMVAGSQSQVKWRIGNAQTWLSAAMTNEDTCVNGFEEVGSGGSGSEDVEMEVRQKITTAKQLTSNALAILHNLVMNS